MGKIAYQYFLNSSQWKKKRNRILQGRGNTCFICQEQSEFIHIHHAKYGEWGKEKDKDLIVLCEDCHLTLHAILDIYGKRAKPLSNLHIRMRKNIKLRKVFS